jgi:hypothetical protein
MLIRHLKSAGTKCVSAAPQRSTSGAAAGSGVNGAASKTLLEIS